MEDNPIIWKTSSNLYSICYRYTRWFGKDGEAGKKLTKYAMENVERWEDEIEAWQREALDDTELPDWFKS